MSERCPAMAEIRVLASAQDPLPIGRFRIPIQAAAFPNETNWRELLLPAIGANVKPIPAQIATVAANIFTIITQVLAVIPDIALIFANVAGIPTSVFVVSLTKIIPHVAAILCNITF